MADERASEERSPGEPFLQKTAGSAAAAAATTRAKKAAKRNKKELLTLAAAQPFLRYVKRLLTVYPVYIG